MILAFDIGNTNVVFGVMKDGQVLHNFRFQSDTQKTTDEYAILLLSLIEHNKIDMNKVNEVLISSVVPPLTFTFARLVSKYFNMNPIIVNTESDHGLKIMLDVPNQLGSDRLMTAVAAYNKFKTNCITVDYGTATTLEAVTEDGLFLGGTIFPGIKVAAESLHLKTAQLPQVDIARPAKVIGSNTIESIQSGLYYGYIDLVDGMISRYIAERFEGKEVKILATGGLGNTLSQESRYNMLYEPHLILDGLYEMYKRLNNK